VLAGNGVPAQLVVYPRSGHFVYEPALQRDLQERGLAWIEHWFAATDGKAPGDFEYDGVRAKKR
jgi:dipeptidyl aminopeptidase/acylaminoacyl peptidase